MSDCDPHGHIFEFEGQTICLKELMLMSRDEQKKAIDAFALRCGIGERDVVTPLGQRWVKAFKPVFTEAFRKHHNLK